MRRFSIIACGLALALAPIAASAQDSSAADDAIHAKYDAVMADYDALSHKADAAFAAGRDFESRQDTVDMCVNDRAGLDAYVAGMDKLDQMIAIIKDAGADPADMEAVKAGNKAIIDDINATIAAKCT